MRGAESSCGGRLARTGWEFGDLKGRLLRCGGDSFWQQPRGLARRPWAPQPPGACSPASCILGRFCELRPIGRKLTVNPPEKEDLWNCMMLSGSDDSEEEEDLGVRLKTSGETSYSPAYRCWYKGEILDLEEEGLWRELLDKQQGSDRMYQLVVKLLDANYATLHYFFHKRFPVRPRTGSFSFRIMHAFTNIKKGVRFVLFDHSVEGYDSWPEQISKLVMMLDP
ncbi:hypothetical protein Celaphus_00004427 [Cervus elaphus hippelaphus]|uniref:FBA domain-containing protein n=1 Tax=Cervus elaphus hippelaphus TaxID=46360 RepID=A0A212DBV8_CEREH|nr:hypothetical protein Celaphus_00004427 [Cervus elaphus hippelaphus]